MFYHKKDAIGNDVLLELPPKRIVSLVPSQTELLFDLECNDKIVGITKFCIYPKDFIATKTIVGGTKNFLFDKINDLKPDLIIANKEENYLEGIKKLQEKYPVWVSDIKTLDDALQMVLELGNLTETTVKAASLTKSISEKFEKLERSASSTSLFQTKNATIAYLIWRKPYMAAATDTFIDEMLKKMQLKNAFSSLERYPEVTPEMLIEASPTHIFLSSEPYPFKEKHLLELQNTVPNAKIMLVDGELFSWYGSRLLYAPDYFLSLKNIM